MYNYLNNLISVQPSFNTRSSSFITLSGPLTSSKLKIANRSFRYASPYLCNKLPFLFHQPHFPDQSPPPSPCSVDVILLFFTFTYLIICYSFNLSHKTQNLPVSQIISALVFVPTGLILRISGFALSVLYFSFAFR